MHDDVSPPQSGLLLQQWDEAGLRSAAAHEMQIEIDEERRDREVSNGQGCGMWALSLLLKTRTCVTSAFSHQAQRSSSPSPDEGDEEDGVGRSVGDVPSGRQQLLHEMRVRFLTGRGLLLQSYPTHHFECICISGGASRVAGEVP
jgi:hypothetical protein